MLSCNIKDIDANNYLSERFQKAYAWLRDTDLAACEVGSYPIDGDNVFANVQAYETAPTSELKFEAHDLYYDVQYVVSGEERFGICERAGLTKTEENPADDIMFFENPEAATEVIMHAGDLIVVPPEQAHMPRGAVKDPVAVRKVVIKVRK